MKSSKHILRIILLGAVILITITSCATAPIVSPFIQVANYDPNLLQTVEVYKNLKFKAANNKDFLYFSVEIKTDSLEHRYSNAILNLWLNSNGLHFKNSGFQFPLKNKVHPLLKNQFSTLTAWGGFKPLLSDTQIVRLDKYITESETKIIYFNKLNSSIELVEADGSRGLEINRHFSGAEFTLNFIIPLNTEGNETLGVLGEIKKNLAVGFEILPNYTPFSRGDRQQQPLAAPGIDRPMQSVNNRASQGSRLKPEIYWLDLRLTKLDGQD